MSAQGVTFTAARTLNDGVLLFWRGESGSDGLAARPEALTHSEQRSASGYLLAIVQDLGGGHSLEVSGLASPEVRAQFKAALRAARAYPGGGA